MIYLIIIILLILFSFHYDVCGKTKNRVFWYRLMMIVLILVAGFRWRLGGDTSRAIDAFYYNTPYLWNLTIDDFSFGGSPLIKLLNSLILSLGGRFYVFQLLESAFVNILLFNYIKKHSQYIFTCVFFYFVAEYLYMNMEILRAAFCIVLCLYANDYMLEKKWIKSFLIILISILFHPQALLVVITPLFLFLRINRLGVVMLIISYIVGYIIQIKIGDLVALLSGLESDPIGSKMTSYGVSKYAEEQSFVGKMLNYYPLLFYSFLSALYVKYKDTTEKLSKIQPFFMLGLMFLLLQLNVPIFYRASEMYKIYIILYITQMVVDMIQRHNRSILSLSLIKVSLFITPLVFSLAFGTLILSKGRIRYLPYTTIFNREIINKRESVYHSEDMSDFSIANKNLY